jgi:5-methylcytosine-specific restriction protein B
MWINQVAKHAGDDADVVRTLAESLRTPTDLNDALAKFAAIEKVTRDLASKGQPAVARIPLVLSIFWSTDPVDRRWPCLWPSAPLAMYELGWVTAWTNAERYRAFFEAANALQPDDPRAFERLLWFVSKRQPFVGLNPALPHMCAEAAEIMGGYQRSVGYPDESASLRAESLARQLKGELQTVMNGLLDDVCGVTGLGLEKSSLQLKTAFDQDAAFRADAYATWSLPGGMTSPGLRLWATRSGLALGLYAGWNGTQDDYQARVERISPLLPPGSTFFETRRRRTRAARCLSGPGGTGARCPTTRHRAELFSMRSVA